MKIARVSINKRKAQLELFLRSGRMLPMPYACLDPKPTPADPIDRAFVDRDLANEAVTYVLTSGAEGAVHVEHALEYNQDPGYLAELLIHKLTLEARSRVAHAGLSRRELARRLNTSVPQLYRLLDPSNIRKSISQLVSLLHVLNCDVELIVKNRTAA